MHIDYLTTLVEMLSGVTDTMLKDAHLPLLIALREASEHVATNAGLHVNEHERFQAQRG